MTTARDEATGSTRKSGEARPKDRLRILILGLDTFARKNVQQIVALGARGCHFDILTNDQRGDSREILDAIPDHDCRLFVSRGSLQERLRLAWNLLNDGRYDLVELYPAGRMALFYLAFLKIRNQRFVVIERGDIGILDEHSRLTRAVITASYRMADAVIYKETYMETPLRELTRVPLAFVPNCIEVEDTERVPAMGERPITFLWVNRIVPQRRPAWVIQTMRRPAMQDCRLVLLGVEARENLPQHLQAEQAVVLGEVPSNAEVEGFVDPVPFYAQARFFCLPSTIVFGNNALLEAMAKGVVPIVTSAPGVELLLQNDENGIVSAFEEDAYQAAMERAAMMSPEQWGRLSASAIATVRERFSVAKWSDRMLGAYHTAIGMMG